MSNLIEIKDNAVSEVIGTDGVSVLDFYAAWCGPCKQLGPVINELSSDNSDVSFGKINVDANRDIATEYKVRSIPLLVFLKDGKEVDRLSGFQSKDKLQAKLDELK